MAKRFRRNRKGNQNFAAACRGKHRHPSEGAALAQKRSMVDRFGDDPLSLDVYFCLFCRKWHVGHAHKEVVERRRQGKR